MTSLVDEISPSYVGAELIGLSTAEPSVTSRSFNAVLLDVDYSDTDEIGGVVLPIEMTVTPPSPSGFQRQIFRLLTPSQIAFTPQEGGPHLVLLREVGHNRVYGTIQLAVLGSINDPNVTQG